MKINEISIIGVSGIRYNIHIELGGKSLLIRGDNGTGKSSIVRSLKWAMLNELAPTDEEAFSSETSFRKHVLEPHKNVSTRLSLSASSEIFTTIEETIFKGEGEKFRNACIRGNPFLQRSDLLKFLDSKPVDRFVYLERFLDLQVADKAIEDYGTTLKSFDVIINELTDDINISLDPLILTLPEHVRPSDKTFKAFETASLSYAQELRVWKESKSSLWEDLILSADNAKKYSQNGALETKLIKLKELNSFLTDFLEDFQEKDLQDLQILIREVERQKEISQDAKIFDLISHASVHIKETQVDKCPVCNNKINPEELLDEIAARIKKLEDFKNKKSKLQTEYLKWKYVIQNLQPVLKSCSSNLNPTKYNEILIKHDSHALIGNILNIDLEKEDEEILTSIMVLDLNNFPAIIENHLNEGKALIVTEEKELPEISSLSQIKEFQDMIDNALKVRNQILSDDLKRLKNNQISNILSKVSEALRKSRQDVAKDVLNKISGSVESYYSHIHPPDRVEEETGAPSLKIQRHGRGTAFLEGKFAGRTVDPRWVYSDGHLDTVGLCVFLALRRYRGDQPDDPKLMILDDVILSIDLGHAKRLLSLIEKNFKDHQLIILTHNGIFAEFSRKLLSNVKVLLISGWSLEEGPMIGDYKSRSDALLESVEKDTPKQIALNLMALADEWLNEARYVYKLSVPAKYGEAYTLTEIWDPFVKAIKKISKSLKNDMDGVNEYIEELKILPMVRNHLSAHENEFAQEYPRTTLVELSENLFKLIKLLFCEKCTDFAKPIPDRFDPKIMLCNCDDSIKYEKLSAEN